jgi:hypothetical protein
VRTRIVAGLMALSASGAIFTGTAGAHFLEVENRGQGVVHAPYERWVGGNGASLARAWWWPARRTRAHGHSAALIDTPSKAGTCTHF